MAKLKDVLRKWGSTSFFSWLGTWFNDSLTFVRREFNLPRLRVVIDPKGSVCCTNGLRIVLGMLCPPMLDKSLTKAERLEIMKGILWHEIGHVLYTPFSADRIAEASMMNGRLWPSEPENLPESLKEYMGRGKRERSRVFALYQEFSNCMEDGRIENLLLLVLYHFRGFAKALIAWREYSRCHANVNGEFIAERIKEFREKPESSECAEGAYHAATAAVLWLSCYGNIPQMEALMEDRRFALAIRRIAPHIALAVDSVNDAPLFYRELNYVFCEMWPYLLPYLESLPEDAESSGKMVTTASEAMEGMGTPMPSDPSGEAETASRGAKVKAARKKAVKAAAARAEAEEPDPDEESAAEASEKAADTSSSEEGGCSGDDEADAEESEEKESSESKPEPGAEEESESEESEKGSSEEPDDDLSDIEEMSPWAENPGETLYEDDDRETRGLDPDMEVDGIEDTSSSLSPEEDAEIDAALTEPTGLDYGDANAGISWRIRRAKEVERDDFTYNTYSKYIQIGKIAAKKIKPFFDPQRKPYFEKDLYFGTKLVSSKLSNPNMKHFSKKSTKPQSPSLSVAILVDESGSMMGRNIEAAKAATIALYEMCRDLDIPYGVFGHTCYDPHVQMTCYCRFESRDPMDKYRLLRICAQRNNRDGAALRYTADLLSKQQTDRRLLIIISDGQPEAHGYSGEPAKRDMQQVIADYERRGVKFIAAAIDSDKRAIEHIYGSQRFLDITNLEQLPSKLAAIIRKCTL